MATTTTNLGLTKPVGTEQALISVINGNMDIIDTKVGAVPANKNVQGEIDTLSDQIEMQDISSSFTLNSSKGTGYIQAFYYPASDMVYLTCGFTATTDMDYSDEAFAIASAYTPSSSRNITAQILDYYDNEMINQVAIHKSGKIMYLGGYWKRMYFAGWYKVS